MWRIRIYIPSMKRKKKKKKPALLFLRVSIAECILLCVSLYQCLRAYYSNHYFQDKRLIFIEQIILLRFNLTLVLWDQITDHALKCLGPKKSSQSARGI